jgi:hypothetical protein
MCYTKNYCLFKYNHLIILHNIIVNCFVYIMLLKIDFFFIWLLKIKYVGQFYAYWSSKNIKLNCTHFGKISSFCLSQT